MTSQIDPPEDAGRPHAMRTLLITSIGVFVASLDLLIVNIAFPDLALEFPGASLGDLSWILNAYAIVLAAFLVPAGRFADRIGRKRVFLAGMVTFTIGSAVSAAAPSVQALVAARIVQALGAAMLVPSTLGLILPAFPPERRAVAVGIWSAVSGVAAALGPPLGGLLVELDWRWIFLVNLPIGVVAVVLGHRYLEEIRDATESARPDLLGAALLALSIGLLTAGIVQGPDWGWADPRVVGAFVLAPIGLALFLVRSARHAAPVIELELLRIRGVATANVACLVFFSGFGAMLLTSVIFLTGLWGYSVLEAGLGIALGPLTAAAVSPLSGRLTARFGPRIPTITGGLVVAVGAAWLVARVGIEPDFVRDFLPGFVIGGIGVGLVLPSLPIAATAPLPPERFATGTAVIAMSRQIGFAIGVAIVVAILGDAAGPALLDPLDSAWTVTGATGLATAVLAVLLPRSPVVARPSIELTPTLARTGPR